MSSISSFLKFLNYFWGPTNFLLLTKPISNISFLFFQEPVCYVTLHDFFNDVKSWVVPKSDSCTNWSQSKIRALIFTFQVFMARKVVCTQSKKIRVQRKMRALIFTINGKKSRIVKWQIIVNGSSFMTLECC